MYLWQAALCVLYERDDNEGMKYTEIADEILRRGFATSRSREPAQTLGKILRVSVTGTFMPRDTDIIDCVIGRPP
jgi:hypothetical protein